MVLTLTGATGFIGRHVLRQFPEDRNSLVVLARKRPNLSPLIHYGHWDPEAAEPSPELLVRSEAVIHLAGEPVSQRWTPEVKQRIMESRRLGTRNLVSAIGKLPYKPKTLVCASAVGVYGDRGDEVLDEESAPAESFLADVCKVWEGEADRAMEFGVRVVKIRIGLVLGEGGALKSLRPLFRMGVGGRLGSGKQWMSWIHVDDLAALFRFAVENESLTGVVNGVGPNPVRNSEFTSQLASAVQRPAILPVPRFAVQLLYGEMSQILFDSQHVLPKAALAAGFQYQYPQLGSALEAVLA